MLAAHRAVRIARLPVRADQRHGLSRHPAEQDQQRLRADQSGAQLRRQHRHLVRLDAADSARAVPPEPPGRESAAAESGSYPDYAQQLGSALGTTPIRAPRWRASIRAPSSRRRCCRTWMISRCWASSSWHCCRCCCWSSRQGWRRESRRTSTWSTHSRALLHLAIIQADAAGNDLFHDFRAAGIDA